MKRKCHGLPGVWVVFGRGVHNGRPFGTARTVCRSCASMRVNVVRAPAEVRSAASLPSGGAR